MRKFQILLSLVTTLFVMFLALVSPLKAQEILPYDNSDEEGELGEYHPSPAYRESESHPLRILAYIVHPIGWVARELIFRPLSYFASSTPETRQVMGYREAFDFRKPSCFSNGQSVPDCRTINPFNYDRSGQPSKEGIDKKVVYFPDVNFDFNKRTLNRVGKEKAVAVSKMISAGESVDVELQGHTDKRGSDEYNMKLGMDRAEAVKRELVSLGVPEPTLSTVSFGERKPLFNEEEEWAHSANRRVEVRLTGQKAKLADEN
jgi:outer membrane protein OmpA-like peptidoglycan-associated protein